MNNLNCQPGRTEPVRLRPYQQDAIQNLRARLAAGAKRLIIVAPTGSGKTTIAAYIIAKAAEKGSRVLFMAHRRELITQAFNRLKQLGVPEDQLGVLMGQDRRNRSGAPVQVASVDTLRNRAKPLADMVFTDEAHRSSAKTYKEIASFYPDAIHLGLTATPFRANGEGLSDAFDDLLVVATPRELIAQGHLVEPRVFTVPKELLPDLSSVKTKRGDYDQRALAEAVNSKSLVGNLVEHWQRHAQGVRTVAFAVSVEHSQHIAAQFRQAGVAAEHLDGTTPTEERDATLARLARGETRLVSNVGLFVEGWDLPSVKCAILARPTRSTGLYLQQAGRIMRPWKGQQAIILDHGGCVLEHGLPQDDRIFSLEGTKKKGGKSSAPMRACPDCSAELPLGAQVCPMCGAVLSDKDQVPKEQEGNLVEVGPEDLKRIELERLRSIALQRGYKPGWVYYRYKERFGEDPPREPWVRPLPTIDTGVLTDMLRNAARCGGTLSWSSIDATVQGAR
jgi:superfamily II DNA or RNA helicase